MKPFAERRRLSRMGMFVRVMQIRPGMRIIDLGGTPQFWEQLNISCNITIVNLPGAYNSEDQIENIDQHNFTLIEGDACNLDNFSNNNFDIAFSNSVIEHVGDASLQLAMANEARRLAPRYWVQTPSAYFPIEAHCGMPFWWFYPQSVRDYFIEKWRPTLPKWTEMVETTTVIKKSAMAKFFPEGRIFTERFLGWPKSYIAIHVEKR